MNTVVSLLLVWIGTWAAAPAWSDSGTSFENDTLRQVVHVSIGGSQVRVRFTNRFGDTPLVIAHASIALAQKNSAAPVSGTLQDLAFRGGRSATIPARADIVSDAVALHVPAQSDVLVSLYVREPTGSATYHPGATQTNFYAIGDRTDDASGTRFSYTYESWYFISGVDVSGTPARGAIVALGDSITDFASATNQNDRWPDLLAGRLLTLPPPAQLGVLNAGISGNRVLQGFGAFGINALARLDGDVLSQTGAVDVIVLLGINDIQQMPHQYDPAQIEFGLEQLALQMHGRGLRVIGCTITPYQGWRTYDEGGEATRLAVNTFIRSSGTFDAVVDFDAALRDPNAPHRLLGAYDSGDHLHPNGAGHRAMADAVDLSKL